jgi:hypothetical protein
VVEYNYSSAQSSVGHWIQVSGKFHASVVLSPEKKSRGFGLNVLEKEKSFSCRESNPESSIF